MHGGVALRLAFRAPWRYSAAGWAPTILWAPPEGFFRHIAHISAMVVYRRLVTHQAPPAERTHDPLPPALTEEARLWPDLSSILHPTTQIR